MIVVNIPQKKGQDSGSPVFQDLKGICMTLGMSKPPANIAMFQFFSGIEKKVRMITFQSSGTLKSQQVFRPSPHRKHGYFGGEMFI